MGEALGAMSALNEGGNAAPHPAGPRRGPPPPPPPQQQQQQRQPHVATAQGDDSHDIHGNAASDDSNNVDDNTDQNPDIDPSQDASPNAPMQKRRRVTRACDECRKKKIKCDGRQPCTHCTVYSYDCTYDQPSHRRRNPAPQYVEQLETRLYRAENILRMLTGSAVNLDNAQLDQLYANSAGAEPSGQPDANTLRSLIGMQTQVQLGSNAPQEPDIESMVKTMGQLELDERGYWDYFGSASALSFLRRFREDFGGVPKPESISNANNFPQMSKAFRTTPSGESPRATQSPPSQHDSPEDFGQSAMGELPAKQKALQLCSSALDDDCIIVKVIHRPTFNKQLERLYKSNPSQYTDEDQRFIPLLFSVLAFGCLFSRSENCELDKVGYEGATDEGYKYFWAARQLVDVMDCRDLTTLQALVFMIMFLQCSAKLGTCYSYIGVAVRSAVRMGLHRSFDNFNPVERETRKRVFWTIRKMDVYTTSFLGLPHFLTEDDIDQEPLIETDDENITESETIPMGEGQISYSTSINANYQLVEIMVQIIRKIYPIKGIRLPGDTRSRSYSVNYTTIREIEASLERWKENLPESCLPNSEADQPLKRRQYLLRIVYAYAQLMLYRPFLHYVSTTKQDDRKSVQQRAYTCAAACVMVARNIVHLTTEMKNKGFLGGSYWFTMYATFVAFLSLVFFALENRENAMCQQVLKDAMEARETLADLAKGSMAADRCSRIANNIMNNLPRDVLNGKNAAPAKGSRKREGSEPSIKKESRQDTAPSSQRKTKRASTHPQPGTDAQASQRRQQVPIQPQQQQSQPQLPSQQQHQSQPQQNNMVYANYNTSPQSYFSPALTPESSDATGSMFGQQSMAYQQQQPQFTLPSNAMPSAEFGDLSNMMFPTSNPFDYPQQPMTSLEQMNYYSPRNSTYSMGQGFPPAGPAADMANMANGSDEQLEAQHFAPVPPPYLNRTSARMQMNGQAPQFGGPLPQGEMIGMPNEQLWPPNAQQGGMPAMNVDDVFGNSYDWGNATQ